MKLLLALLAATASFTVPPPGSGLRKNILDALRPAAEKRLGRDIEFRVTLIRVQRDWAYVVADPRRKGGKPIDGNKLFGEHFSNMDGLRMEAVLRKQRGRWVVVEHAIGATGVWYCDVGPRSLKAEWGC